MPLGRLFVLEGIDLVGKSTVAEILAKKLGATRVSTPYCGLREFRHQVDGLGNHNARFFFYLASLIEDSKRIVELLSNGDVVCDRYIFSTLAYHKALGVRTEIVDVSQLPIVWPDQVFYLELRSEKERVRRLRERREIPSDFELERDAVLQRRVHDCYSRFDMTQILTDGLQPEQVADCILHLIYLRVSATPER